MLTECWLLFIGALNVGTIAKYEIENLKNQPNKQKQNPEARILWNKKFIVYGLQVGRYAKNMCE